MTKNTTPKKSKGPKQGELILADGSYYSMDCYKTRVNNNVLAVGTSGAGKTRTLVIPNLLQAEGSYVISDPKGSLHKQYSKYLEEQGYKVYKVDFVNPEKSDEYNFFDYIRSEDDYIKIANMIVYNGPKGNMDPFWDEATILLLSSLIAYLKEYRPRREQNLNSITKLAVAANVNEYEYDAEFKNCTDLIMDGVRMDNPDSFAAKQYSKFRVAAAKTLKSILISLDAKLSRIDRKSVEKMMCGDPWIEYSSSRNRIDFTELGRRKAAIFVEVSDSERSMDPLANLFFTQAINELCYYADNECEGNRLPVPVRFIFDDFATNVSIEEFPRIISSIRSRGISAMLCIQSEAQLSNRYKEDGRTIIGNCDTYIYLGGNDVDTARNVARRADIPEKKVLNMPVGEVILFRRGEEPVITKSFNLEEFEKKKMAEHNRKISMKRIQEKC